MKKVERGGETLEIQLADKTFKPINILEVDVETIIGYGERFIDLEQVTDFSMDTIRDLFQTIGPSCTDWKPEEILKLTPIQVKAVFNTFKEVNTGFLQILEEMGALKSLKKLQANFQILQEEKVEKHFGNDKEKTLNEKEPNEPQNKNNESSSKPSPLGRALQSQIQSTGGQS